MAKKKEYSLDLKETGTDYYMSYTTKGHHDFDLVIKFLNDNWPNRQAKMRQIVHTYFRTVYNKYSESFAFVEAPKGGRGAYPATFISEFETSENRFNPELATRKLDAI